MVQNSTFAATDPFALTRLRRHPKPTIIYTGPSVEFDPHETRFGDFGEHGFGVGRQKLAPGRRARLIIIQCNRCYLCGETFHRHNPPTQDHVMPLAHGGRNRGNILLAHGLCNNAKGDRLPTPFETAYLHAVNAALARHAPPPEPVVSKRSAKHEAFKAAMAVARERRLAA